MNMNLMSATQCRLDKIRYQGTTYNILLIKRYPCLERVKCKSSRILDINIADEIISQGACVLFFVILSILLFML